MDYEKLYREALERARRMEENSNGMILKKWLWNVFPELAESEDERIRKDILAFIKRQGQHIDKYKWPKWIAWLKKQGTKEVDPRYENLEELLVADNIYQMSMNEAMVEEAKSKAINALSELEISKLLGLEKQGEQKPTLPKWKYKKDNTPLLRDSIILNKYGCVAKSPSGAIVSDVWVLDYDELAKLPKEELEKQCEQKPTKEVKSKFKVGDWVILTAGELSTMLQIINVDTNKKRYWFNDSTYLPIVDEECLHLWTIQDAKDGDILCYETKDELKIFIYKNGHVHYHCCYCNGHITTIDSFFVVEKYLLCYIHPATKEQCSTLFSKMKEAGYEWDSEKKELKKSQRMISAEAKDALYEQKAAWSEEDEHRAKDTIYFLDTAKKHYASTVELDACIFWIKSLRERVQATKGKLTPEAVKEEKIDNENKVESKFKIGDWVVFNNHHEGVYQIEKIENFQYTLRHILGGSMPLSFSHEDMIRLWTIQDAKNGDVLATQNYVYILNSIDKETETVGFYCLMKKSDEQFSFGDYKIHDEILNSIPATKEQRELLFTKMREAGYEWNANKKELKKAIIGPKFKVGDWCIDNEDATIFQIVKILDNTYTYKTNEGSVYSCTYYSLENDARLWTIEDAKDGDVLAFDNDTIVIFKDLYNATSFHSYCHIEDGVFNISRDDMPDWWNSNGFHPATKKQHDIFFSKIKEEGYEWDAEKKEIV